MKNNFIPRHIPDVIVNEVESTEARRIKERLLKLKSGINPHDTPSPGYIPTTSSKLPTATTEDRYFRKQNKLRGKQRNIKFMSWAAIKLAKFKTRSTPISTLEDEN